MFTRRGNNDLLRLRPIDGRVVEVALFTTAEKLLSDWLVQRQVVLQAIGQIRVGDKRTAETNQVGPALSQRLFGTFCP
jgi:hypothetical protein